MCHTSRNFGTSLFSWLVLSLLLLASATCRADTYFWQGQPYVGGPYVTGTDAASVGEAGAAMDAGQLNAGCQSTSPTCYQASPAAVSCSPSGAPTAANQGSVCTWQVPLQCGPAANSSCNDASLGANHASMNLTSYACSAYPTQCAGVQGCASASGSGTVDGLSGTSGTVQSKAGCVEQVNPPGSGVCVQVPSLGSGWTCAVTSYPVYENGGGSPAAGASNNCVSSGSTVACLQTAGSGAGQCGTFNGDQVCPASLPNDSCVFYASGGSACTVSAGAVASGAPTSASGGAAAVTGVVTAGPPNASSVTANYYSSTTVSTSSTGAQGSAGGVNVGNGGTGSSGSGGGQSSCGASGSPCSTANANAAGDGDCSTGDCSAAGNALPAYDWSSDSWDGALTSFWSAVSSGPIATAVQGISANWPSGGSCPSETVVLTTLNYTADYGTAFCNLWENSALPVLQAVMLAVWSITAVFIFLSA